MYTLHKLEVEKGKHSRVPSGSTYTYYALHLSKYSTKEIKRLTSINEVEEGWQVFLTQGCNYHRTSEIQEILSKEGNKVTFRTKTSIYELTQEFDEVVPYV